ncbi:LEAF RUST 10 DISEASE-RESISTANCE LOCUS RECEPTOR-LIKE PROTEIN KINASE-like [Olea europaea subsp. europaea]|uniref:LEAF RUST 10 DISEASE-RESISTANCE LOCUS RECEPTOR-LIKE PROTEIN KINASE-like n=1 Tax=Olea europaea subsp. europaea TaxID=158383 RepID=A0A8S0TD65_OLEEU|nr:LEAF RUST 10 DISEASE-RESISTANCE LOCUS RECEPTOR-LIKE PROTEIN KINASE-like [Olea europaea subsp. europaea]
MPQPPSTTISTAAAAVLLSFLMTLAHSCSPPLSKDAKISCPPFKSIPPFPFSFSSGCGHPFFQLHCSSSHTTISINNISFSLLQYEPNSTSLTLSPTTSSALPPYRHHNCSSPHTISTLNRSISLTGSPFRVSDSSCSRLSALKPCPPPNLPNCSRCSWECNLIKNPLHLLHDCGSSTRHREDFQPECQSDVLGVLENILRIGFEVEWDEDQDSYFSSCKSCRASNGFCGFNSTDPKKPFVCFPSQTRIKQKSPNRIAVLSIIFLFMCFLIAVSIGTVFFRSRRNALMAAEEDPTIIFLRRHRSASLLPPVFTYEELESSTNRFDPKRKIGDGGFGSVYLGQLYDGRIVAVKHLHKHNPATAAGAKGFSTKSFCNEILILSSINHPNLVKLHGYCSDPRGLLLVYDYVPNGTLSDHLHGKKSLYQKGALKLTWNTRVDIAMQTAMAIEYLHFSVVPPVVHRDITSSNIFVEKDMRVKVGDFGLSRLLVCSETSMASNNSSEGVWTGPQGTPGYLDPDYYRSFRLNEKSDIYSFGVVLLELITGMRAVDQNRDKTEMALADMVVPRIQMGLLNQVVDPVLVVDGEAMEGVGAMAELAFRCVAADKDDRPDAREVAAELRRIKGRGFGGGMLRGSNSSSVVVPDGAGLMV